MKVQAEGVHGSVCSLSLASVELRKQKLELVFSLLDGTHQL